MIRWIILNTEQLKHKGPSFRTFGITAFCVKKYTGQRRDKTKGESEHVIIHSKKT